MVDQELARESSCWLMCPDSRTCLDCGGANVGTAMCELFMLPGGLKALEICPARNPDCGGCEGFLRHVGCHPSIEAAALFQQFAAGGMPTRRKTPARLSGRLGPDLQMRAARLDPGVCVRARERAASCASRFPAALGRPLALQLSPKCTCSLSLADVPPRQVTSYVPVLSPYLLDSPDAPILRTSQCAILSPGFCVVDGSSHTSQQWVPDFLQKVMSKRHVKEAFFNPKGSESIFRLVSTSLIATIVRRPHVLCQLMADRLLFTQSGSGDTRPGVQFVRGVPTGAVAVRDLSDLGPRRGCANKSNGKVAANKWRGCFV